MRPLHRKFALAYVKSLNATQAAIEAGLSPKTAYSAGPRLLKRVEVQALVQKKLADCELTAERTLREIGRIAYQDPVELFDASGKLKSVVELDPHTRAAVAQVEVLKRNLVSGDGTCEEVHKVKLWDKNKALELAAKYLRLLDDRVEHDVKLEISWKPRAALPDEPAHRQAIEAGAPVIEVQAVESEEDKKPSRSG